MQKLATLLLTGVAVVVIGLGTTGCSPEKKKTTIPPPAKTDAPKADAPKADAPKADAPKADAPKADAPKADAPK